MLYFELRNRQRRTMLFLNAIVFCLIKAMFCGLSDEKPQENHSQNIVVSVGGNVTLKCRVNPSDTVSWHLIAANSGQAVHVFVNGKIHEDVKSMYRINNRNSGQFDLIIDSADRGHAGKYSCKVFASTVEFLTYLTVIERDPICGTNATDGALKENDQVLMWCEVNSTGFLKPKMKWTKGNGTIESSTKDDGSMNGSVKTTSNTTLLLQSQDNNVIIQCTTSFKWPNGSQENIPEYKHAWQYLARVQYGVKNITIEPNGSSFKYGDQLVCLADGNPAPTYTWTHNDTGFYGQTGSVLTLTNSLSVGAMHVLVCTAQNTVDGKIETISKAVSIYINAQISTLDKTGNSAPWIAACIGGAVVIFLIIILCIFCRTKTKTWLIMRFSSLQRKFSRDPDVLPRESSSRDVYVGGCMYPDPHSAVYHEVNDQPGFQLAEVPLYNENQAAAARGPILTGHKETRTVTEDWDIKQPHETHAYGEDSQNMDFTYDLQMEEDQWAPEVPRRAISKNRLVGGDGTEYLDFGGVATGGARRVRRGSPTFTPVETYTLIDHCNQAPPLPPKKY